MKNLKNPLFWAYAVLVSYFILSLIIRLIISSLSIGSKLSLVFGGVSLCIVFVFTSRFLSLLGRRIAIVGIFLLISSIPMMYSGISALYDFLDTPFSKFSNLRDLIPLPVIAGLPLGVLLFFFSAWSVISGIRLKRPMADSSLDRN